MYRYSKQWKTGFEAVYIFVSVIQGSRTDRINTHTQRIHRYLDELEETEGSWHISSQTLKSLTDGLVIKEATMMMGERNGPWTSGRDNTWWSLHSVCVTRRLCWSTTSSKPSLCALPNFLLSTMKETSSSKWNMAKKP